MADGRAPGRVDKKAGRVRFGRTKAAEAKEDAAASQRPSILAVKSSQPPPQPASSIEGGPSRQIADTAAAATQDRRADRAVGAAAADGADDAARAAPAATARPPTRAPYNYRRNEPIYGQYFDEEGTFEIPQAKKRGPVRIKALRRA